MAKYEACYDSLEGMKTHDKPNHTVHLMFDFVVRTEVWEITTLAEGWPKGDQGNTSSMVCFQRNRVGHKRNVNKKRTTQDCCNAANDIWAIRQKIQPTSV